MRYMTIEVLEDGLLIQVPSSVEYTIGGNWETLEANGSREFYKGQFVSFKKTYKSGTNFGTFVIKGMCNLRGNCMSMIFGDSGYKNNDLSRLYQPFCAMFENCNGIVSVDPTFLPATTLAPDCYNAMFRGCTSLTTAPALPATTLANGCYNSMFYGCSSLTTAPELPATTLANGCYNSMFHSCTNITTAPSLPATTLTYSCYDSMFYGCTSLTTAPQLPSTILVSNCYQDMFNGCTSLTTAPALPATILAYDCYDSMFYNTNILPDCSNIDFASSDVVASGGLRGLFAGTNITDSDLEKILPKNVNGRYCLPATALANGCYDSMFYGCTSLTTAPALPATTLAPDCYDTMFRGCTSLTTAPALPATTLANGCYDSMFYGCTSLTTAPALPATTLAEYCYRDMFNGCSKLNYIKMLATDISASNCLTVWVSGVASTGTFVKNPDMTSLPTGASGIPSGWTVVNDGED